MKHGRHGRNQNQNGPNRGQHGGQNHPQPNPVTAPLTPKQLGKEIGAATRLEYRPLERKLAAEMRSSRQRQRQISKLYRGLTNLSGQQAQQASDAYATADQRYKDYLGQVGTQDATNANQIQWADNYLAGITGATPDTSALKREAAAQAQRGQASAGFGGLVQAQGANQQAYLRNLGRTAQHEGIGQRQLEAQNMRQIQDDIRSLAKDKGDYRTKYLADQRQAERDYKIQLMAFNTPSQYDKTVRQQSRAGVQQAQINAGAVRYQADQGLAEQQARNHGYKNLPRGGGGGGSGIDPKTAASYLRQRLQSQNASPGAVAEHKQSAIDYLVNRGVSRKVAQRVVNGYIKRHASKGGRGPTIDWELW